VLTLRGTVKTKGISSPEVLLPEPVVILKRGRENQEQPRETEEVEVKGTKVFYRNLNKKRGY